MFLSFWNHSNLQAIISSPCFFSVCGGGFQFCFLFLPQQSWSEVTFDLDIDPAFCVHYNVDILNLLPNVNFSKYQLYILVAIMSFLSRDLVVVE